MARQAQELDEAPHPYRLEAAACSAAEERVSKAEVGAEAYTQGVQMVVRFKYISYVARFWYLLAWIIDQ